MQIPAEPSEVDDAAHHATNGLVDRGIARTGTLQERRFEAVETVLGAVERKNAIGDPVHGDPEDARGALRQEADTEDAGRAAGTDLERAGELSGEERPGLEMPFAIVKRLAGRGEIHDELGAAIGHDA